MFPLICQYLLGGTWIIFPLSSAKTVTTSSSHFHTPVIYWGLLPCSPPSVVVVNSPCLKEYLWYFLKYVNFPHGICFQIEEPRKHNIKKMKWCVSSGHSGHCYRTAIFRLGLILGSSQMMPMGGFLWCLGMKRTWPPTQHKKKYWFSTCIWLSGTSPCHYSATYLQSEKGYGNTSAVWLSRNYYRTRTSQIWLYKLSFTLRS